MEGEKEMMDSNMRSRLLEKWISDHGAYFTLGPELRCGGWLFAKDGYWPRQLYHRFICRPCRQYSRERHQYFDDFLEAALTELKSNC